MISCNRKEKDNNIASQNFTQIANNTYDKELGDSAIFRMVIVKSIKLPFNRKFDTLIVKSKWKFLDEIPDDYPYNYPETNIDKPPFIDTLSKLLAMKVISDVAFDKYMERVLQKRFKGEYPESLFDSCLFDNLYINITTKRLRDNSFLVKEDYRAIDTSIRIQKKFMRIDSMWNYEKVDAYQYYE